MKEFRMTAEINQSIVNGILQGYKNYIEERKAKKKEMNISTAYKWVKGNHIDDQVAEECHDLGVSFTKAKAGYSWGYLQFNVENERRMFIMKNARYFDVNNFPQNKGSVSHNQSDDETYLKKLSRINKHSDFPEEPSLFSDEEMNQMVSLFPDATLRELEESDARRLEEQFDQFYIITYEIDESFAISAIKVLMPNPHNNTAYIVEDLSEYIGSSTISFDHDDYSVLKDDEIETPDTPAASEFNIGIAGVDDDTEEDEK